MAHKLPPPVPQPTLPPQLVITLDASNRVQVTSNLVPGPSAWPLIAQLLHAALGLALQQLTTQATEGPPDQSRIIVPALDMRRIQ